ncbi:IclR family transcriptional regulator [Nonomuraea sp. NPDC049152]|uniref:IclR family transcriptional regulator n=1 Tax=Nonomuraea sp. NPDC049152 TaxID=3154350 RepID=UPI0033F792D8
MIDPNPETPRGEDRLVGADRVLVVLRVLAERPEGIGLEEMAKAVDSPKPTVHRALAALRRAGFAVQDGRGRYLLGDEFLRLAFTHHEARPDHVRIRPALERLAGRFGETAHYAVLDGREVVYRAKVDPPSGPVRLTSTVGGRNPAHSTGVGKLLLAWALPDDAAVAAWAREVALERRTPRTKVTVEELCAELAAVRERGCAVDDQENEVGVNCVAVPVFLTSATTPSGAVSVSALAYRTSLPSLVEALPEIHAIVKELR